MGKRGWELGNKGGGDWETLRYGTERDGSTTWELGEKGTMELREMGQVKRQGVETRKQRYGT